MVLQIYPRNIPDILKHFPDWKDFESSFKESVRIGQLFKISDIEYNWRAFERREKMKYFGIKCYMSSKEDLVISKLSWYNISQSEKQLEDLKFLLLDQDLNMNYVKSWVNYLNLKTYGIMSRLQKWENLKVVK